METAEARWALVTGASSGIGAEFARLLAAKGYSVVLVARREERLRALAAELERSAPVKTRVIAADLSEPGSASSLAAALETDGVVLDVLVNNAGFGGRGAFSKTEWDREHEMMQLNMVALVELTKRILPGMVSRGRGHILNVASTAAFQPGPFMAVYFATKAFVLSFSEAVNEELRGTGVSLTTLCPGPTDSEFFDAAKIKNSALTKRKIPSSLEVARTGLDAMFACKRTVIHGLSNRIGTLAGRFLPRGLVIRATRGLLQ